MARLPDPKLEKISANEEYDGMQRDKDRFFEVLADLIHGMHIKKRKENKEIA